MHRGYIALWRKYQQHPFWKERRVFSKAEAWIDVLWEAQHSEKPQQVIIGMTSLTCQYGESLNSMQTWAQRWNWGKSKVKRFLDLLQNMGQITIKSETITTRISVLNYEQYDPKRNAKKTTAKRQRNDSETTSGTDNNGNNGNNAKEPIVQDAPSVHEPVFISIPLKDNSDFKITHKLLQEFKDSFPNQDVEQTLREIRIWNISNKSKRKTRNGVMHHISSWMERNHNKGKNSIDYRQEQQSLYEELN